MNTKCYLIDRVIALPEAILPSTVLHLGHVGSLRMCDYPGCKSIVTSGQGDVIIDGYSDLLNFPTEQEGFVPLGPPLIGAPAFVDSVVDRLDGVKAVRVAVNSWDQSDLPELQYRLDAFFKALEPTESIGDVCNLQGEPLPKCPNCSCPLGIRNHLCKDQLALPSAAITGKDIGILRGLNDEVGTFITDSGLGKLGPLALKNFELREIPVLS